MTATLSHVTDPDARELPLGGRLLAVLEVNLAAPLRINRVLLDPATPGGRRRRSP